MIVLFRDEEVYHAGIYDGSLGDHLIECQTLWASQPKDEWVHSFVHTLDEMPQSWYISAELCREITTWEELTICFNHTFIFVDVNPDVHNALQLICDVFLKVVPVTYPVATHTHYHKKSMMECYNVSGELDDDDL